MDDLAFIIGLMKQNREELGFIPNTGVAGHLRRNEVLISKNHEGYLLHGAVRENKPIRVHQTAIEYDLRDRGYGRELVERLIERAVKANASCIRLRCAEELSANDFWKAMGFVMIDIEPPNNTRKRKIIVWSRLITAKDYR